MLFTELRFVVFFVLVLGVHWALRGRGARKTWLLLASYVFYGAWDWRFLSLIALSTLVDYVCGLRMGAMPAGRSPRRWLALSLSVNLGLLGVFKYYDFFIESAVAFTAWLGLPLQADVLGIVLPVGISFYTFQTLSYSIDVARKRVQAVTDLRDFALFVAFFPQLVAGPILRASEFLPQLRASRRWAAVDVRACLTLFLVGYVKKAVLADQVAMVVDPIFADPGLASVADLWLGASLYAIQIYGDFSGYSDMAIATGGLLGYRVPINFNHPYVADSVRAFWRRWHISLSTWFRDYLYIPLGGNRGTGMRTALNLLLVFLLCGLWHGAAWTFVAWGAFHGVFLMLERTGFTTRLPRLVRHGYTLLVVLVAWVLFRCTDLAGAVTFLAGMLGLGPGGTAASAVSSAWWLVPAVFAALHVAFDRRDAAERLHRVGPWSFALGYGVAVALVLPWAASGGKPFIYFQF